MTSKCCLDSRAWTSARQASLVALALLLLGSGLLKIAWPEPSNSSLLTPVLQRVIGLSEWAMALALGFAIRLRTLCLIGILTGAMCGVVVHLFALGSERSCGCLGKLTPLGPSAIILPALLGALSCQLLARGGTVIATEGERSIRSCKALADQYVDGRAPQEAQSQ